MAERRLVIRHYQRQRGVRLSQIEPGRGAGDCGCELSMGGRGDRSAQLLRVHQASAVKYVLELSVPALLPVQSIDLPLIDPRIKPANQWLLGQYAYAGYMDLYQTAAGIYITARSRADPLPAAVVTLTLVRIS